MTRTKLVLVHGILGTSADWGPVAERLAGEFEVVCPDLVGYGGARRTDRIDELWADAQARALAAHGRAVYVGHDFGAPVCVWLYRERPELVAGLGLLAGNLLADTPIPFPVSTLTWPLVGGACERLLLGGPGVALMARRWGGDAGDAAQRRATRTIFAHALRELRERYAPVHETLGRIDVPTLVGWGDRDPFFPLAQGRRSAAAIPGARLAVHEGAGHGLPAERPEQVARDIAALARTAHASAAAA